MAEEVTIREAAEAKGVTIGAINRAIREGRLPARIEQPEGSARGRWKIKREDLAAWTPAVSRSERGRRGAEALHRKRNDAREAGEESL